MNRSACRSLFRRRCEAFGKLPGYGVVVTTSLNRSWIISDDGLANEQQAADHGIRMFGAWSSEWYRVVLLREELDGWPWFHRCVDTGDYRKCFDSPSCRRRQAALMQLCRVRLDAPDPLVGNSWCVKTHPTESRCLSGCWRRFKIGAAEFRSVRFGDEGKIQRGHAHDSAGDHGDGRPDQSVGRDQKPATDG